MEEALGLRREECFSLQHTDEKIIHLHYSFHSFKDQNPLIMMMIRELIIKAIRTFIDSDSIRFYIFNKYLQWFSCRSENPLGKMLCYRIWAHRGGGI